MQRFDDQALLLLVTGRSASDATSLVRSLYCCLTTQGSVPHPTLRARAALPHPQLLSFFRGRTVSEKPGACNSSHLCLCVTGVIFSVVQTNPKIAQALQTLQRGKKNSGYFSSGCSEKPKAHSQLQSSALKWQMPLRSDLS